MANIHFFAQLEFGKPGLADGLCSGASHFPESPRLPFARGMRRKEYPI